jgi:hypothetical protein
LEEEQQAEVCMGTSVALRKPRDDENRADKTAVDEEMVIQMRSMGDPGKTSFNRWRMCSAMRRPSLRKASPPQADRGRDCIAS